MIVACCKVDQRNRPQFLLHGILIHFEGNVHYVVLKSVISEPP